MTSNPSLSEKHNVTLIDRKRLNIDGVNDVLDFDGDCINIKTTMGILSVEGNDLKIIEMSKEESVIYIEGTIDGLFYYGMNQSDKKGIFKRKK